MNKMKEWFAACWSKRKSLHDRVLLNSHDMRHLFYGGSIMLPGGTEICMDEIAYSKLHVMIFDGEVIATNRLGISKPFNKSFNMVLNPLESCCTGSKVRKFAYD